MDKIHAKIEIVSKIVNDLHGIASDKLLSGGLGPYSRLKSTAAVSLQ